MWKMLLSRKVRLPTSASTYKIKNPIGTFNTQSFKTVLTRSEASFGTLSSKRKLKEFQYVVALT